MSPPKPAAARKAEPSFIPVSEPNLSGKELAYVEDCLRSGWISSHGQYLDRFEGAFARYLGVKQAISHCNGTAALHSALLALGIGPGDEVIVPTFTYIATPNAVRYTGARPVFVDMERDTWNLAPDRIERAITPRTKAIVPVHLYGHPCDLDAVLAIATRNKLFVVEDAAEAFGSRYRDRPVGTFGHLGVFSFFGNKTITTGEGGMVVTDDPALARTVRLIKGQGMSPDRRYFFERVGYNYRMTNLAAAIGLAQLERADELVALKRRNAGVYREHLSRIPGIGLPVEKSYALNTYWMFSITVEPELGIGRDELMKRLADRAIETRPFFFPCHTMPPYAGSGAFPVAEEITRKGVNLPSSTRLEPEHIERIALAIREARP